MRITVLLLVLVLAAGSAFAGGPPATYTKSCQSCHGADGKGSPAGVKMGAPDFASAGVQKMTDDQLSKAILTSEGHKKFPHNYATKGMTPEQAKEIVAYIRSLKK
ncbi:MAG: cytochrome c [Candidatus Koribacter versatilis]|uniref:Cytochrome c n=1 Tax=Candidatus Korobacter versatilis TaxID=658062 RepID=A0A932A8H5_9BACT|nr:cytochrome c [Candidatus Koribacter versatilis]